MLVLLGYLLYLSVPKEHQSQFFLSVRKQQVFGRIYRHFLQVDFLNLVYPARGDSSSRFLPPLMVERILPVEQNFRDGHDLVAVRDERFEDIG